jgi:Uma2 family endonuclease
MALTTPDLHRVTVDEFNRMCERGVFDPDERIELIDGTIVDMTPIGPPHAQCVDQLTQIFTAPGVRARVRCRVQGPIQVGPTSRPQPDISLVPHGDYRRALPMALNEVLLVIEVADASLDRDGRLKVPLYAQGGIQEHWLVNLDAQEVEVYREPRPDGSWEILIRARPGDTLSPLALPDLSLPVQQIFG